MLNHAVHQTYDEVRRSKFASDEPKRWIGRFSMGSTRGSTRTGIAFRNWGRRAKKYNACPCFLSVSREPYLIEIDSR